VAKGGTIPITFVPAPRLKGESKVPCDAQSSYCPNLGSSLSKAVSLRV
jgi:hypothetical protein